MRSADYPNRCCCGGSLISHCICLVSDNSLIQFSPEGYIMYMYILLKGSLSTKLIWNIGFQTPLWWLHLWWECVAQALIPYNPYIFIGRFYTTSVLPTYFCKRWLEQTVTSKKSKLNRRWLPDTCALTVQCTLSMLLSMCTRYWK